MLDGDIGMLDNNVKAKLSDLGAHCGWHGRPPEELATGLHNVGKKFCDQTKEVVGALPRPPEPIDTPDDSAASTADPDAAGSTSDGPSSHERPPDVDDEAQVAGDEDDARHKAVLEAILTIGTKMVLATEHLQSVGVLALAPGSSANDVVLGIDAEIRRRKAILDNCGGDTTT